MATRQKRTKNDIFNSISPLTHEQEQEEIKSKRTACWITKVGNFQVVEKKRQNQVPNPSNMFLLMDYIAPFVETSKDEIIPYTISNMTDLGPSTSGSRL